MGSIGSFMLFMFLLFVPRVIIGAAVSAGFHAYRSCLFSNPVNFPASSGFLHVFDPANGTVFEPNLDPVRMVRAFCQNIPDNALGQLPRTLVLLLYDPDPHPGPYPAMLRTRHEISSFFNSPGKEMD